MDYPQGIVLEEEVVMKGVLSLLLIIVFSFNSNQSHAQDVIKGEALFAQCIQCHGQQGEGNPAQKAPKLSGQHDWYLVKQITEIKSGVRKNSVMLPFVAKLTEQDIKDLAAFISKL